MASTVRSPFVTRSSAVLDRALRHAVDAGRGLVEDEDRRVLEQRPRDGDALLLAAGEPVAAFAHDGVVAVRQAGMKSWMLAARAASSISSSVASGRA